MSKPDRYDRLHSAPAALPHNRSPGQRDRDRILYSDALQRLANVTQVASPGEGIVFHNRLTHTHEVAQIARRLAEKLCDEQDALAERLGGIDPDVVEAAALAHDLGHPPFGHIAEDELDRLARSNHAPEGFEGNAQSFRIVVHSEAHRHGYRGLDLTRATLNALLKYPWLRDTRSKGADPVRVKKFGAYSSEVADFRFARAGFGRSGRKSIEAAIMDRIFRGTPSSVVRPVVRACRLRSLRHQGESSPPDPPCVAAAFVDTANDRHPNHRCAGRARRPDSPRDPLIDPLRQLGLP